MRCTSVTECLKRLHWVVSIGWRLIFPRTIPFCNGVAFPSRYCLQRHSVIALYSHMYTNRAPFEFNQLFLVASGLSHDKVY
jgi:hypothetical protein